MSEDFDSVFPQQDVLTRYPVYCIYKPGDFASEYYLNRIIPTWENYGFKVTKVPSILKEDPIFLEHQFKFRKINRSFGLNGSREFFLTEKLRYLSHYFIWKKIAAQSKKEGWDRAFIIEHDCKLQIQISEDILNKTLYFLANNSSGVNESWLGEVVGYNKSFVKPCVGYMLNKSMAAFFKSQIDLTDGITIPLNQFLFNCGVMTNNYSWNDFNRNVCYAVEEYDVEVGNTVKDDERPIY